MFQIQDGYSKIDHFGDLCESNLCPICYCQLLFFVTKCHPAQGELFVFWGMLQTQDAYQLKHISLGMYLNSDMPIEGLRSCFQVGVRPLSPRSH